MINPRTLNILTQATGLAAFLSVILAAIDWRMGRRFTVFYVPRDSPFANQIADAFWFLLGAAGVLTLFRLISTEIFTVCLFLTVIASSLFSAFYRLKSFREWVRNKRV